MNQENKMNIIQKTALFFLLLFFTGITTFAQNISVSGVVTETKSNDPLPGVTVVLKGTTTGTITDNNGHYSISAPSKSTLVFTYIGYNPKEVKVSGTTQNITLEPTTIDLEDVVVVGTSMRKSDLTGAVGSVSESSLKSVPSTDLNSALQGKVAGVYIVQSDARPGSGPSIKIRGNNSISYGTSPIYVIDGIIMDEGINSLNPNDISSVEVLKDASATALYGSRASNGVVVVTTKKGKKGKSKVTYDGWVGISNFSNMLPTLNAAQLYDLRVDAYANSYMDANAGADRKAYIDNTLTKYGENGCVFSEEELYNGQNNITSDWISPLVRTGIQQNHSLSFSGASETGSFYVGLSYTDEAGVLANSSYKHFGGKINLEQQINPWLKIGTNTTLSYQTTQQLDGDAFSVAMMANPMQEANTKKLYIEWQGVSNMGSYNPILSLQILREPIQNRMMSSNYIDIKPMEGLSFRSTISTDIYSKQDYQYTPKKIGQSVRDNYEGIAWHWKGQNVYWQWDNSVSYDKTFNSKHRVFAMAGTSMSKMDKNSNSISTYGYPVDDFGYKNLGASYNKNLNSVSSNWDTNTLSSFIGRVNYTYEHKYYLTGTLRADGSSKFLKGNEWGIFPSISTAWNITEEPFMESIETIDNMKLRLGYGAVGNQNVPSYAYTSIYNPSYSVNSEGIGSVSFISDGRLGNPDLTWEKQKQVNAGLDVSFLDERLTLTADYFFTKNTDLLMQMSLSPTTGFNNKIANVGEMENKGFEFTINAIPVKTDDMSWSISANISHDKNKVTKLYNDLEVIWSGNSITSREGNLFVGQPLNTFWSYKVDKIAQQEDMGELSAWNFGGYAVKPGDILPMDKNGDKAIKPEDDMFVVGNKDPKFYGGFSTNFTYKNFSLDAVFNYSYGARRYSWIYDVMMGGSGTFVAHTDMLNRWTPENTNTIIPRAYYGSSVPRYGIGGTDWVLLNSSFLRCSALTLAYNFSSEKFSNLKIYASANNLFMLTNYKGFDPEGGESYPTTKMFTLGVTATF